jgi:hypothetical protein
MTEVQQQKLMLDVVGAFAEDHAFEIALRGKLAGHE